MGKIFASLYADILFSYGERLRRPFFKAIASKIKIEDLI